MSDQDYPPEISPEEMKSLCWEALEFAGIGIYRYRFDGTVIFMDRGALRLLDLEKKFPDPAGVNGKNIGDLIVYEGPAGLLRREVRERGHIRDFRYPFRTLSGKKRWALHDSYLVADPETGEESIQVVVKDITALKKLEEELEAERELLAVTLRSIGDGVISTDIEARVILLNKEAERLTGWKQPEARGKPLAEIFRIINEQTRQPAADPVERVLAEGRLVGLANHTVLIARDGAQHPIADSAAPIYDPDSRVIGVVLVFRDVENERRAEALSQRAEKLESLGVLAGGIAHDFNNYLTGVMGNISLARMVLEEEGAVDKVPALLDAAERSSRRACGLTDQLLTFAKGGAPVKSAVGLAELIARCTEFSLSGSAVRLDLSLPEDLWPLEADPGQLAQVVDNIVINAKQALAEKGTLKVTAENAVLEKANPLRLPEGRYIRLEFCDDGPGIPVRYQERIFDPYFTTKQRGSGLGLATVHSIVGRHGGAIQVESRLGEGARFTIHWPAAPVPAAGEIPSTPPGKRSVRGKRVLVMDDMEDVGIAARTMLESLGYTAGYVENGEAAVRACRKALRTKKPFDAVILDLTVPGGMGGVETLKALREFWPEVRALASSGYSTDPVMADCAKYHFQGFIRKPYTLADLARAVAAVVGGGK